MSGQSTIAVLPFETPGDDPESALPGYLARGVVQDVAGELSRFSQLDVVHPDSAAAAWARAADLGAAAASLGASWLVTGRLEAGPHAPRLHAALVELPGARQVWSDRFVAEEGLQRAESELAEAIAAQLAQRIDERIRRRSQRRPEAHLEAYDLWLRGMETLRGGTLEDDRTARAHFQTALERDPCFARAHAGLSLSYFNDWSCQAWERWDENEARALEHAQRAVELDESDHVGHMILGRILQYQRHFDRAERHIDLSLELNPNDADVLIQLALCVAMLGDGPRAHELVARAMRLHPMHPDWYFGHAALACLVTREVERGIDLARRAFGAAVDLPAHVAAGYAHLGDRERARRHIEEFRRDFVEKITFGREPDPGEALRWVLQVNPFRREADRAYLEEGLLAAGLEADPDANRASAPSRRSEDDSGTFRDEGDVWSFDYGGRSVQLRAVKGFRDLARLLERPGEEIHCVTLSERPDAAHGGDPALDARARREVGERIRALQDELDEAEARADLGRSEAAREELDALVESLAKSLGLAGRERRLGSASEKARSAVTWRIRSAIQKIGDAHPDLGRHLQLAVRTGTWCRYEPERPVAWRT